MVSISREDIGNQYHYVQLAKEIAGVSDVKPFKRFYGPNTIKVVILDEEKRAPAADMVQQVQEHIDAECPIGADVTVVRPLRSQSTLLLNLC